MISDFEQGNEMSYRSGLQNLMFAIMTNWKTEFHKPLTRPGVKHDEEMSICSSIPRAHRGYINSSLLESDLKMSESHANVVMLKLCSILFADDTSLFSEHKDPNILINQLNCECI